MGIGKQEGRACLAAIRAGTNRANSRAQVADAIAILQEWLTKKDVQDAEAFAGFAASRPSQYDTFLAALPEPTVDQTP